MGNFQIWAVYLCAVLLKCCLGKVIGKPEKLEKFYIFDFTEKNGGR